MIHINDKDTVFITTDSEQVHKKDSLSYLYEHQTYSTMQCIHNVTGFITRDRGSNLKKGESISTELVLALA